MALVLVHSYADGRTLWSCLSSDTKPTTTTVTNLRINSELFETNGGRFTYQGTTAGWVQTHDESGAARVSVNSILDGILPQEQAFTMFGIGDPATAITVAASGNTVSVPIDTSRMNRDHSTICIVISGSGTAKIGAQISRDGVNDLVSLGDIRTGMMAGSYAESFTDTALAYGHYLTLTVTETGGANSVGVKVFVMGRRAA